MPWVAPQLPIGLPDRLALIIEGLCQAVAARGPKAGAAVPLIVLVWGRLPPPIGPVCEAGGRRPGRPAFLPAPPVEPEGRLGRAARDPSPAFLAAAASAARVRLAAPAGAGDCGLWQPDRALAGRPGARGIAQGGAASRAHPAPLMPDAGDPARPRAARLAPRKRLAPATTPDPAIPAAAARAAIPSERPPDPPPGSSPRAGSAPERPRPTRVRSPAVGGADPPLALPEPA
jgi:hypothetical protein